MINTGSREYSHIPDETKRNCTQTDRQRVYKQNTCARVLVTTVLADAGVDVPMDDAAASREALGAASGAMPEIPMLPFSVGVLSRG